MSSKKSKNREQRPFDKSVVLDAHRHLFTRPIPTLQDAFCMPVKLASPGDPIMLVQLEKGKCHQGSYISGILCVTALKIRNQVCTVLQEDGTGLCIMLRICNLVSVWDSVEEAQSRLRKGAKIVVKEPCLMSNFNSLYVDNPASIQLVCYFPEISMAYCLKNKEEIECAADDEFHKFKHFGAAAELNSKLDVVTAMIFGPESESRAKILCYRAECRKLLKCYLAAANDSELGYILDGTRNQGLKYYTVNCKAKSLWNMRRYSVAYDYVREQMKVNELSKCLEKAALRLKMHSETGSHDIREMELGREEEFEVAEYVGPVELQMVEGKATLGMFLTSDVKPGDLLFVDIGITETEVSEREEDHLPRLIQACIASPRTLAQVMTLVRSQRHCSKKAPSMNLFKPNLDDETINASFDTEEVLDHAALQEYLKFSPFCEIGGLSKRKRCVMANFIRHSCVPNVYIGKAGMAMYCLATRNMKAGTELRASYYDTFGCLSERRTYHRRFMTEECDCQRCKMEDESAASLLDKFGKEYKLIEDEKGAVVRSEPMVMIKSFESWLLHKEFKEHEKAWFRASYHVAYCAYFSTRPDLLNEQARSFDIPAFHTFLNSCYETDPGYSKSPILERLKVEVFQHRNFKNSTALKVLDKIAKATRKGSNGHTR